MQHVQSPSETEYAPFFGRYIDRVTDQDIVSALRSSHEVLLALLRTFPEAKGGHRYAEGKWSVKEVIQHITDTAHFGSHVRTQQRYQVSKKMTTPQVRTQTAAA